MAKNKKVSDRTEQRRDIVLSARNESQKEILRAIKDYPITIIAGPPGSGKALTLDSKVYTPSGPVRMGDIKVGDEACTPNGDIAKVTGVYPQGELDIYRLTFADGDFVDCCIDHLWEVMNDKNAWAKSRVVDTRWIIENYKNSFGNLLSVPMPTSVAFHYQDVDIDPYLLGVLLGDGCITGATPILSTADSEMLSLSSKCINSDYEFRKQLSHKYEYSLSRIKKANKENDYTLLLKQYGVFGKNCYDKFIPDKFKYNSEEIRLSVLQGLMDTDGYVSKESGLPGICLSSEQLAKDVKEIVSSLGGICVVKPRKTTYTYKSRKMIGNTSWRCSIRFNDAKRLFRLSRKQDAVKNRSKYPAKRIISDVVKIGKQHAQCIMIDHPSHLFLTDNFVVTHNTHLPVVYALQQLLRGVYQRIIFTRPCVEAYGENLGFLPGDFNEKIGPYMMPIFDILCRVMDKRDIQALIESGVIQTIPLAYQRGITFNDAFVVADEFQNTIPEQVRMFLTRMGENCKIVITGDPSQNDIRGINGLDDALQRFSDSDKIKIIRTSHADIVRNPLVEYIDKKYMDKLPYSSEGDGQKSR